MRKFGEGNGKPLQYSCLEISMDRGGSWTPVHVVSKSWTRLSTHTLFEEVISVVSSFFGKKKKKKGRTSKIPNLKKKNLPKDNWHYFKIIVFLEKCCEGASWAFCGWGGQSLYEVCLVEDPKPHNCKQGFAWLHVHWPHRPRLFSALILYCWVVNSPYSGCSLVSNVRWPGAGRSQPPGGLRKLLSSEVLSYL